MNSTDPADSIKSDSYNIFFCYLPIVNLTLAVYIIIQNSMVIYHYFKDWKKLSSLLFLMIAAVDIGSACSAIAPGSITLLCYYNINMVMPYEIYVTILMVGNLFYVTSTFFGMVLTVVKTINIINPFYRIRGGALKLCLVLLPLLGLVLCVVDAILTHSNLIDNQFRCSEKEFFSYWFAYGEIDIAIGTITLEHIIGILFQSPVTVQLLSSIISRGTLSLEVYLPGLIVFICMILQIVYIKVSFSQSADPRQNVANHATITVLMISFLYVISDLVHLCSLIVWLTEPSQMKIKWNLAIKLLLVGRFTLPLVNSALFPTVLILRKAELRATYSGYISTFLHLPVTVFNKIRHRVGGYTEFRAELSEN